MTLQISALELPSAAGSSPFSSGFAPSSASSGASWGTGVVGEAETVGIAGNTLARVIGVVCCSGDESKLREVLLLSKYS